MLNDRQLYSVKQTTRLFSLKYTHFKREMKCVCVNYLHLFSLFHTAIPENTWKMCPVICPGMVWFWFIHTASDFPESVRAFTHNP